MKARKWVLGTAAGVAMMAGCVTPTQLPTDPHLLDFLHDGSTTKEAVVLKLGQPSLVLESGRIFTYRLGEEPGRGYFLREATATNWMGLRYSLVLIFNQSAVLEQHSVVPVR